MLQISPYTNNDYNTRITFQNNRKRVQNDDLDNENPISRKGEVVNLIKTTFVGGLLLGGRLLFEILDDGDFLIDSVENYSKKLSKAKHPSEIKKLKTELNEKKKLAKTQTALHGIGAFIALLAAGLSGFALLYTILNAPKIAYKSKVNTFQKGKEMDVYIKANEAERELYTQLDEKAQNSSQEEKDNLKTQYLMMQNAKNRPPEFVKIK